MWFKSIKWLSTSNKPNIILIWSVRSGSVSILHSCNQLEISFQKALECSQKTKRCSRVSSFLSQNEHKGDSTSLSLNSLELSQFVEFLEKFQTSVHSVGWELWSAVDWVTKVHEYIYVKQN